MTAIIRTIDQRDMGVQEWTAASTLGLQTFGPIPVLLDDNQWQSWGAAVLGLASLSGVVLPDPYTFDDWREWANNFNAVLDGRL